MNRTINVFAVTKDGIGRSQILQPKVHYTGKGTKWFDDSKLIKKEVKYAKCD